MNLFQKVLYAVLFIKEKVLSKILAGHIKCSYGSSTSKTYISKGATLDISATTKNNIELVKNEMSDLVAKSKFSSDILIDYAQNQGVKVLFIKDVTKILNLLGEEQGFITERRGIDGLMINLLVNNGISFNSKPVIILEKENKDFYYILFTVYKLCGYLHKLPGYDYKAQKLFKTYAKFGDKADTSKLKIEELNALKQAVSRDNEASKFVIEISRQRDSIGRKSD